MTPRGVTRSPAQDEHGGENDVDRHRERLDVHRRPDDADATQGRRHREHRELQGERGHEPDEVCRPGLDRCGVGGDGTHVGTGQGQPDGKGERTARDRQPERLIEGQVRIGSIFAANSLRDRRQRADAYDLRQGVGDEAGIASRADAGNGVFAQAAHEVEIDQSAEQDQDKSRENGDGHGQDMAQNRALGEIFHDDKVR